MAKYLTQRHGEVDVKTYDIYAFANEAYNGIGIEWASRQIGFGNCTILFIKEGEDTKIVVESECMASNDDKTFLVSLFEDIIERAEIVE